MNAPSLRALVQTRVRLVFVRYNAIAAGMSAHGLKQGDEAHRSATTAIRILPSFPDINLLFTISIHDVVIYQQRFFSWPTEKEGLPVAEAKTY